MSGQFMRLQPVKKNVAPFIQALHRWLLLEKTMKKFLMLAGALASSLMFLAPVAQATIKPLSPTCNAKCHCLLRSNLNSWKPASNGHGYSCWNRVDGELFAMPGGDPNGDTGLQSAAQADHSRDLRAQPVASDTPSRAVAAAQPMARRVPACAPGQKPPCNDFGIPALPSSPRP